MPDQLPSALLDSTNSFDSLFALDLDTKQRFDNILSGVQKPMDYPIPNFDKDFNPKGLSQSDLLDPNLTKGSIGEGMFSNDPKVASYAKDKLLQSMQKLPVSQGIGAPTKMAYDPSMNKFLKGDFGYNPYMSNADNEDFNYRYDYLNKNLAERIFKNVGVGLGRFVGSVALKLGQTVGYLGSMIGNGIQEIYDSKNNNFMADVANNSLSRWFEAQEQDMKDSNALSVFKPKNWDDKGFFSKMAEGGFWTDEFADGAAFMGEMIASTYLMGGLGKVAGLGKLGETSINMSKFLSKYGGVAGKIGKGLDVATQFATGAEDISGIGRWAFATTSESAMEASGLYKSSKQQLQAERTAGTNHLTDDEINKISGDRAAASFKANMLILSASNAFENKFLFNPIFKKFGVDVEATPNSKLVAISGSTESVDATAKASRKTYNYSTWLGKKLDWKNSNGHLRFYGGRGLSAIAAEGFWEENAQLAVERLAGTDNLSMSTFLSKLGSQGLAAAKGFLPGMKSTDPEAEENIGLGGLIGIGGTSVVAKVRGGDKWFEGERRKTERDTQTIIDQYETYRKKFLNFNDIYITEPVKGSTTVTKPVLDGDGNLQVDEVKAAAILDGMTQFTSKLGAVEKFVDPLQKKFMQDDAMSDFVVATKSSGLFKRSLAKFKNIDKLDDLQLKTLGFDPNSVTDAAYLISSLEDMGKIHDRIMNAEGPRITKGSTEVDDETRRLNQYKAESRSYSAKKIAGEYEAAILNKDFASAFSDDAADQDTAIDHYNSMIFSLAAHNQFMDMARENGEFYNEFDKQHSAALESQFRKLLPSLLPKIESGELVPIFEGHLISKGRFEKLFGTEISQKYFKKLASKAKAKEDSLVEALNEDSDQASAAYINFIFNRKATNAGFIANTVTNNAVKVGDELASDRARSKGRVLLNTQFAAQAKWGQMRNVVAQNDYLAGKLGDVDSGLLTFKEFKKYSEGIQEKDEEADKRDAESTKKEPNDPDAKPPENSKSVAPVETPTEPTQRPLRPEASNPLPSIKKEEVVDNTALVTEISGKLDRLIANVDDEEAIADMADAIKNNAPKHEEVIQGLLNTKISALYTPLDQAIKSHQLNEANHEALSGDLVKAQKVVTALEDHGVDSKFFDALNKEIETLADLVDAYDFDNSAAIQEFANRIKNGEAITSTVDQEFYSNNVDAIEAALRAMVPKVATSTPVDPRIAAIEARREAELKALLPQDKQSTGPLDFKTAFTSGIPAFYQQLLEMAQKGEDTIAGVKEKYAPILNKLYKEGKLKTVEDVWLALNPKVKEVNDKYDAEIAALSAQPQQQQKKTKKAPEPAGDKEDMFFTKVGKTNVMFSRKDRRFYYTTPTGRKSNQKQSRLAASKITDRFFRNWFKELSTPEQRKALNDMMPQLMDLVQKAMTYDYADNIDTFLMRRIKGVKFSSSIMKDLTDVAKSVWSSTGSDAFPLDTFVTDHIGLGEDGLLAQEGFTGYDESDIMNIIRDLIQKYPKGITLKDIQSAQETDNPTTQLEDLHDEFLELTGLDLNKAAAIYYEEKQSLDQGQTEVPEADQPDGEGQGEEEDDDLGSQKGEKPPKPPAPPPAPGELENSPEDSAASENQLDIAVNLAKQNGLFTFVQNVPKEIAMDGSKIKIVDGVIKLKTTEGDQQEQLTRQHNVLKVMGNKANPVNFETEVSDGKKMFRIKLIRGDEKLHEKWTYQTAKGLLDSNKNPYKFPQILAVITDQNGDPVYFSQDGQLADKVSGQPVAFPYSVTEYTTQNLNLSRKGALTRNGEALNGSHSFENEDPLTDIRRAVYGGVDIYADIDGVTSGWLSGYNITNETTNATKSSYTLRTIKEMLDAGDIGNDVTYLLRQGSYEPITDSRGTQTQFAKVGQPFLFDPKSGYYIPLRGKNLGDLTLNGKPIMTGVLKSAIEALQKDGVLQQDNDSEAETAAFDSLFQFLRSLFYSADVDISRNPEGSKIFFKDLRPIHKPLMETEVNYTKDIDVLSNPITQEDFSYSDFVAENFRSGALPVELKKGERKFDKLNKRIIFTLEKNHAEIIASLGITSNKKTMEVNANDTSKFVGKTYKRSGKAGTVTVTSVKDGKVTVKGPKGEITQTQEEFAKNLNSLQEVTVASASEEVTQEFEKRIKLSKDEVKDLIDKAKTATDDDIKDIDFSC